MFFNKSRQSIKGETKHIQSQNRLSLPSIKHNQYIQQLQSSALSNRTIHLINARYKSQTKLTPVITDETSPRKLSLKLNTNSSKQASSLTTFRSSQKSKEVYLSPSKKIITRLNNNNKLPDILSDAKFIIKKSQQDSLLLDSSHESYQKFKKQILNNNAKSTLVQPQLWVIKKRLIDYNSNSHAKSSLQQIITNNISKQNQSQKSQTISSQLITSLSSLSPQKLLPSNNKSPPHPTTTIIHSQNQHHNTTKHHLIGPKAIQKFYSHYKKIDKHKQLQQMQKQFNPLTIILTVLQTYNIPPKRMDIIKIRGNQSILDLNHIGLGQSISIKAISDILEKLKYFRTINLSYNQISFDRVGIIIPQLKGVRKIDLSHNHIVRQGVDLLAEEIVCSERNVENDKDDSLSQSSSSDDSSNDNDHLQDLNLQQNGLSDQSMNLFLIKAKSYKHLKILNLSRNFLGNHFALRLKQFLIDQNFLNQLYLHWNDITSKGMKYIFEGLTMNKHLKVLDLSWNQIGYEAVPAVNNFFRKNTSLLHLDISNCNILREDSKQFAESIKNNHTLIGLHYEGNQGHIDTMGFIHLSKDNTDKKKSSLRHQILSRISGVSRNHLQSIKSIKSTKYHFLSSQQQKQQKNCWICDGWQQQTIIIKKIPQHDQACFIHFDFQQYKGLVMAQSQGNYLITKMFPPQKISFFITKVNKSKQFIHQCAIQYKGLNNFETQKLKNSLKLNRFYIETKQFKDVQFMQINVFNDKILQYDQLFDKHYSYQAKCRPRTYNMQVDLNLFNQPVIKKKKVKIRKQRNKQNDKKARQLQPIQLYFNNNQSSTTQNNNKSFIRKCAQFDISNSKIRKLIPNQQQINAIHQILEENYSTFSNIYKHLSNNCVNSTNSIYHVSEARLEQFLDFMQFQTKNLSRAKIRLKIIATLSLNDQFSKNENKAQAIEQQQRLFTRPQFFQFLLRLAIEQYCKSKKTQQLQQPQTIVSPSQGFTHLLTSLKTYQQTLDLPSHWRTSHLQTYDISLTITSYQHFISDLYNTYTGLYQKNISTRTQKKMLLNQFKQIFLDCGMRKTREALKDAEIAFADSKQLEVEEGIRQQGLIFSEFVQAIVRMAYVNDLKPIGTENHKIWQRIQQMQDHHQIQHLSQKAYFEIPLFLKFQSLLKNIYKQNRQLYHSRKMDRLFDKGIFSDEIQMLIEILKQRVDHCRQKYKPTVLQHHSNNTKKIKLNTMVKEEIVAATEGQQNRFHNKITLQYLVKELKIKFKKIADQLDMNFNEYDQVQQNDTNQQNT